MTTAACGGFVSGAGAIQRSHISMYYHSPAALSPYPYTKTNPRRFFGKAVPSRTAFPTGPCMVRVWLAKAAGIISPRRLLRPSCKTRRLPRHHYLFSRQPLLPLSSTAAAAVAI